VSRVYSLAAREYYRAGNAEEALRLLDGGMAHLRDFGEVQYLYSTASAIQYRTGRYGDAIELLISFMRSVGKATPATRRTAEQIMFMALPRRDVETLGSLRALCSTWAGFEPLLTLCDVLLLQCTDRFDQAAEVDLSRMNYLAVTMQVAFSLLCCRRPADALNLIRSTGIQPINAASYWMVGLVYWCNRQDEVAAAALERVTYRPVEPEDVDATFLLRLWDDSDDLGVTPAFYFPRLPPTLTSLEYDLVRPGDGDSGSVVDDDVASRVRLPRMLSVSGVLDGQVDEQNGTERGEGKIPAEMSLTVSPHITLGIQTEAKVGDTYNAQQVGAQGAGATASGNTFNQIFLQGNQDELANQLRALREAMRGHATEPEHDLAVAEVGQAELAVRDSDPNGARSHLARAGSWALARANEIGTAVAAAAIKASLGL
jgi:hypothetical protein